MKLNDISVLAYHAQGNKVVPHYLRDAKGREGYHNLVQNGLIEEVRDQGIEMYQTTERGRVFANSLMSVPLPVTAWIEPGKQ